MGERYAALGALLAVLLLAGCTEQDATATADTTAPAEAPVAAAPAFTYLDGSTGRLSDHAGGWVFVNYWAEWCGPCLEEIPELNELHEAHAGAVVLGVNYDQLSAETMAPQVETLGIRFPVLIGDPAADFGITTPEVLPSTFVFAPDGSLSQVLRGPQTLEALEAAMAPAT